MNFELITTAFAQAAEPATKGNAPIWPMMIALFAIFYFFIIRPQSKKQKETQSMLATVDKGARVITIGGIVGTIMSIKPANKEKASDEDIIVLKVGDNTKLEMIRSSISKVVSADQQS